MSSRALTTKRNKGTRKAVRRRPTFDDVCEVLFRLVRSQEQTNKALELQRVQFAQEIAEWNRRFEAERTERVRAEAKRRAEEAERYEAERKKAEKDFNRRWNQLEGMFTSQWGKLVEQLVNGDLVRVLNKRGIAVHRTSIRNRGCFNGQNFEFDIIACNGDTIVVVEVKTTLRPDDVKHFTEVMGHFRDYLPQYKDMKIQGAFGYLSSDAQAAEMAQKDGFWTIHATGGSAKIDNNATFQPRYW